MGFAMAPKFGTSGLRGLVTEMTPNLITGHVVAFLVSFPQIRTLYLGRDLRPSSPAIADIVAEAALAQGVDVVDCGPLPTPALALAALSVGGGAVMVTGSHIPADRNGLKFYKPSGEISKPDEAAILGNLGTERADGQGRGVLRCDTEARARFGARYLSAFGTGALAGLRIGLYAHSSVGRDLLAGTLTGLGAELIELSRSEVFIPIDTEVVSDDTRARIRAWVAANALDAVVSTDGDADRPLLADETGAIVPGDILGQITSAALGVETLVTPISSNSGCTAGGRIARVIRTRIGSPHVIEAMQRAGGKVAGYEANGGYLLGFGAQGPAGPIAPLWTRDCFLPLIVALMLAREMPLSRLVAQEPGGVTRTGLLRQVPPDISGELVAALSRDDSARQAFLRPLGAAEEATDLTDGLRMTLDSGEVVHIRASGNAPELRLYVEAATAARADVLLEGGLVALRRKVAFAGGGA